MVEIGIGKRVNYGALGECVVCDRCMKNLTGTTREYLVLQQVGTRSTVYLPLEKAGLLKEVIGRLTEDEVNSILSADPMDVDWSDDDKKREAKFKKVIESDDARQAAALVKAIYRRQNQLKAERKKPRAVDLNTVKICEKIIFAYLSRTLELELEAVGKLINGEIAPVYSQKTEEKV